MRPHSDHQENHYEADNEVEDTESFGLPTGQRSSSAKPEIFPRDTTPSSKESNTHEDPARSFGGE